MEIRSWRCYIIVNIAFVIPCLVAKPFSLNEIVKAEKRQKLDLETSTRYKLTGQESAESYQSRSIIPFLPKLKRPTLFGSEDSHLLNSISPLRTLKKALHFRPFRTNKLGLFKPRKPLTQKKPKAIKRETSENELLEYLPLIKKLGMLFNDILDSESSEAYDIQTDKYKRKKYIADRTGVVCTCSKPDMAKSESKQREEAIVPTTTPIYGPQDAAPVPVTATASPPPTIVTPSDVSNIRQNKNVPVLSPRNTVSLRRNRFRNGTRSGAAFHRNHKGNITGHHGNNGRAPRVRGHEAAEEVHDGNTDSNTRHSTGEHQLRLSTRHSGSGRNTNESREEVQSQTKDSFRSDRGHHIGVERKDQFEIRRNETKNPVFIREPIKRHASEQLRGSLPEDEDKGSSVQHEDEQSDVDIAVHHAGDQRLVDGTGANTTQDQDVRATNEGVITIHDITNPFFATENTKNKSLVVIIDGYSVARYKNGQNKLTEKIIHIQS